MKKVKNLLRGFHSQLTDLSVEKSIVASIKLITRMKIRLGAAASRAWISGLTNYLGLQ